MSNATPNWTSYLAESAVWSGTDSAPHYLHAFDESGHALCNRRIRPWSHREGGSFFRPLAAFNHLPLYRVHDRCRTKAQARVDAHPDAQQRAAEQAQHDAERAEEQRQSQRNTAVWVFAEVHPAAERLVNSVGENTITADDGSERELTPAEVWGQIGAEPGREYGHGDDETNDAMPEALYRAWQHLDRLAAAGALDSERWDELVTAARDVLAPAYAQPGPVALDKAPASWQVLWHTASPLTGERWADFPVHSVVRTEQLRAGHDWSVIQRRLTEQGLSRYGFPVGSDDYPPVMSAAHALGMAREKWQTEGPHAAWFEFTNEMRPWVEPEGTAD